MGFSARLRGAHRVALAIAVLVVLTSIGAPARADTQSAQNQVNNAQQYLNSVEGQAQAEDNTLAAAQASLASYTAQVNAMQARIAQLDSTISSDTQALDQINANLASDRARLGAYVRQSYENGGSEATLVYLISSKDISTAIQRKDQVDQVATAAQTLIARINHEQEAAASTLAADRDTRAQLAVVQQQLATEQALVAVQTEQVQAADIAAHAAVNQAQGALAHAQQVLSAAEAELAAERSRGTIFNPVNGPVFTVDTDLSQPSGENASTLNGFLKGTALANLGDSFMHAEQSFHVSARYFVAHAILESAWGTSAIARNKHNLFGFNADDANPYQDATTFPSFDACIQYVAQFVAQNYLSSTGRFYHGPTLRGMNVDYASDPYWASKIASIADTIP